MKIIFLDIDGVLNYSKCWKREENKEKGTLIWDKDCISQLNRIVKETGAKIVISSTWRLYKDHYDAILNQMNIEGEIIDKTIALRNIDSERGDEIEDWLSKHPEVKKFVILDDDDDMKHLFPFLIQSDFMGKGLTKELADKAIEMLCS